MQVKELIKKLDELYPLATQQSWDNSGLQIGDYEDEVKGVYISLDVEYESLVECVKNGFNTVITHHPLFFNRIKSLEKSQFHYRIIKYAMDNKLNIISYHTPFDSAECGMINAPIDKIIDIKLGRFMQEENMDFGYVAKLKSKPLSKIVDEVMEIYKKYDSNPSIRVYGDGNKTIEKISFMGGSGGSYAGVAVSNGSDLFITGDVKYHNYQEALREGVSVIDLTHPLSEIHFVDIMEDILKKWNLNTKKSYQFYRE